MNLSTIIPWEERVSIGVPEDFSKLMEISQSRSRIFLLSAKIQQLEDQINMANNPVAWYNASIGGFWLNYNKIPQYERSSHDIVPLYTKDLKQIKYTKDFKK